MLGVRPNVCKSHEGSYSVLIKQDSHCPQKGKLPIVVAILLSWGIPVSAYWGRSPFWQRTVAARTIGEFL